MATKTIPSRIETTCDRCAVLCTKDLGTGRRVMSGVVDLFRHGLDYSGSPCGPGGFKIELCDKCIMEAEDLIHKFVSGK